MVPWQDPPARGCPRGCSKAVPQCSVGTGGGRAAPDPRADRALSQLPAAGPGQAGAVPCWGWHPVLGTTEEPRVAPPCSCCRAEPDLVAPGPHPALCAAPLPRSLTGSDLPVCRTFPPSNPPRINPGSPALPAERDRAPGPEAGEHPAGRQREHQGEGLARPGRAQGSPKGSCPAWRDKG